MSVAAKVFFDFYKNALSFFFPLKEQQIHIQAFQFKKKSSHVCFINNCGVFWLSHRSATFLSLI